MTVFYNENDPIAAEVLRELSFHEIIAPGVVDARSIKEITPDDVRRFTQCHFFAGAGTWSVAARLADWPDDRPLWTASCPCQPFSVAGKGAGTDDPRHLWPDVFRLVRAARPNALVGEQVGGAAGYAWLDGVFADLESEGYTCRAVDIPASAVNAPHKRSRLYWVAVADAQPSRFHGRGFGTAADQAIALPGEAQQRQRVWPDDGQHADVDAVADAAGARRDASAQAGICGGEKSAGARDVQSQRHDGILGAVAQPDGGRGEGRSLRRPGQSDCADGERAHGQSGGPDGGGAVADAQHAIGGPDDDLRGGGVAAQANERQEGAVESGERNRASGHYCPEWDGMLIRPGDPEFECCTCKLEHAAGERRGEGRAEPELRRGGTTAAVTDAPGDMGDAERPRLEGHAGHGAAGGRPFAAGPTAAPDGGSFWRDADWIICHDGKARRTPRSESGFRNVVDGLPARSAEYDPACLLVPAFKGRTAAWRLTGNSIVAPLAAEVLKALMETLDA